MKLKIATRTSPLALWQTEHVKCLLMQQHPELNIELLPLVTEGDKKLSASLKDIGGKALFVKELETAMLEKRADLAVHSLKDMPFELPDGLTLAAYCEREDPRDVLISQKHTSFMDLPEGAKIGTASPRRQSLLKHLRPDLNIQLIRGNLGTRLKKLNDENFDAIVLAAAGILRLEQQACITEYFDPAVFTPATGQGVITIECRKDDENVLALLSSINHKVTEHRITAERAMNRRLTGDCHSPLAAHATCCNGDLIVNGFVGQLDGSEILRATIQGPITEANQLGTQLADDLLSQGADKLLKTT